jgi:hypothetical protein
VGLVGIKFVEQQKRSGALPTMVMEMLSAVAKLEPSGRVSGNTVVIM